MALWWKKLRVCTTPTHRHNKPSPMQRRGKEYEASAMNAEIQIITEKRLELANSALIQNFLLRQLVGLFASSNFSKELPQGKRAILTDTDNVTTDFIQEMQRIWTHLQPLHGHSKITPEVYKYYWDWEEVNERASLAFFKIHFGHWKAWQLSPELTKVACSQLNLIACTGIPYF